MSRFLPTAIQYRDSYQEVFDFIRSEMQKPNSTLSNSAWRLSVLATAAFQLEGCALRAALATPVRKKRSANV